MLRSEKRKRASDLSSRKKRLLDKALSVMAFWPPMVASPTTVKSMGLDTIAVSPPPIKVVGMLRLPPAASTNVIYRLSFCFQIAGVGQIFCDMGLTFASIVDEVRRLSPEEQEELLHVLERERIEMRRQEILGNFRQSLEAERTGQLQFSANAKALLEALKAS